jgi:hypothetical protein
MRKTIVGGSCLAAFCLAAGAALADPGATVSGAYSDIADANGAGHVRAWHVDGSAVTPLGASPWSVQADASYNGLKGPNVDGHVTNLSASVLRTGKRGRIGATVGYNAFPGLNLADRTNYGAFGEYWAGDRATLALKGGGVSGGGTTATYGGGEVVGYLTPDVALSGSIDHLRQPGAHITVATAQAEWLPSRRSPASLFAAYSNVDFNGPRQHVWLVGFKLQFGAGAKASLVERQRTGPAGWAAAATVLKF